MKKELNKKEVKKNLSCDLLFIEFVFYEKRFIKNYEAFESKVFIAYVYALTEKVIWVAK